MRRGNGLGHFKESGDGSKGGLGCTVPFLSTVNIHIVACCLCEADVHLDFVEGYGGWLGEVVGVGMMGDGLYSRRVDVADNI